METKDIIKKKKLDKILCIFNDDVKVIDFLSDLQDRKPIRDMEKLIRWGTPESALLLFSCPLDDMVVLLIYKSPFGFNEKGNNLMIYAHNNLRDMIKYFKGWHEATLECNSKIHLALDDILRLLYWEWAKEEDMNTQVNHLG